MKPEVIVRVADFKRRHTSDEKFFRMAVSSHLSYKRRRARRTMLLGLALIVLVGGGCRPSSEVRVAPVSGTVHLDGKPLENVRVLFVSLERSEDGNQGPIAFAVTDAEGNFTLAHRGGGNGAAIGKNQVWLTTRRVEKKKDAAGLVQVVETNAELIPPKYNASTQLVFDVPTEGTSKADFELKSDSAN